MVSAAFPGMTVPLPVVQESPGPAGDDDVVMADDTVSDEDEEEIDDDEDGLEGGGSASVEQNGALAALS